MKTDWMRGIATACAGALLLAACQPIVANPTPAPETLGFEAVPPPAAMTLPHVEGGTTLYFLSGENCMPVTAGETTQTGEAILFDCGMGETYAVALIGALDTIQGQVFQTQRAQLAVAAPGAAVLASSDLPFSIASLTLADGTTCLNPGEDTNLVVGDAGRVSFVCNEDGATTTLADDADVLVNGLYPGEDGVFTVDRATLTQAEGTPQVENTQRVAVASLVAQPLVVTVTGEESGKTVYLTPAQTLEVMLMGNPTTGYTWLTSPESSAPLQQAGEAEFSAESTLVGAGGTMTMRYDVTGSGSGDLLLDYARAWETDTVPADTFSLHVITVLTMAENNSSITLPVGETLAVMLPGGDSMAYQWQVVDNDGSILAQTSDPVQIAPRGPGDTGGMHFFTFEGVAPGEMTLQMEYYPHWQTSEEPISTYALNVTVE